MAQTENQSKRVKAASHAASRTLRLAVVMDPIETIHPEKDTSLALLLEASRRGYALDYAPPESLSAHAGIARCAARSLKVHDSTEHWFELGEPRTEQLGDYDVILMRKDPPFNQEFIYLTYLLELAERAGAHVVNKPGALRDYNEKAALARFPEFAPPTLITRQLAEVREFRAQEGTIVIKPLDGMGGRGIFVLGPDDPNLIAAFDTASREGANHIMVQRYLPEIREGDKRVLLIGGRPVPCMLARIPAETGGRGNLAAGARGEARPLGAREREIAEAIGPGLARDGLDLVGLDIIGESLTEVNVTSPTCVRELDRAWEINIAADLFDVIEARIAQGTTP
jgi:glutathione synthase